MPRVARNPKVATFSVRVDQRVKPIIKKITDAVGQNKSIMAAIAIAVGLNMLEQMALNDPDPYLEQRTVTTIQQVEEDARHNVEANKE